MEDTPPPWSGEYAMPMMFFESMGTGGMKTLGEKPETLQMIEEVLDKLVIEEFAANLLIFLKTFIPIQQIYAKELMVLFVKYCRNAIDEILREIKGHQSVRRLWKRLSDLREKFKVECDKFADDHPAQESHE